MGNLSLAAKSIFLLVTLILFPLSHAAGPTGQDFDRATMSLRKTLGELIKADTTNPPGSEARAVTILAARLKQAGIAFETMEFGPGRQNLVARLKGNGEKKALLLLAHRDVVGTEHQEWTSPSHELTEKDGYLYGRGVRDDLGMAVANLEAFLLLKSSGLPLKRDVILAFTGDEESGGLGIRTMIEKHPDWLDADIAINEGGSPVNRSTGQRTDRWLT